MAKKNQNLLNLKNEDLKKNSKIRRENLEKSYNWKERKSIKV